MTAHAQLQVRRPAATHQMAVQRRRASLVSDEARGGESQHSAMSDTLNAGPAVQRLARIQAQANAPREPKDATADILQALPSSESEVVQGVFFVQPMPNGTLSNKANANLTEAVNYLGALGQNVVPNLLVRVENINTGGTNPADTNYNQATSTIRIRIQNWYLEMASVGEMMGMLTHEIGVHSLAEAEMTTPQKTAETNTNHLNEQVQVGGTAFPLAGQQGGDARQMDHLNAVKLQLGGQLRARGQVYLNTFLRMGDAIEADGALNQPEKTRRQRDLLDTFLFDVGRMLATDDGGAIRGIAGVPGATAMASGAIADVMNWYRNAFLGAGQYGAHPWLNQPALQQAATGTQVITMLLNKVADYGVARAKTASTTSKLLGGAVAVGAVAAGVAFAPMTTLALGAAGLGYGLYRYFSG
jgi:hypothetical protein